LFRHGKCITYTQDTSRNVLKLVVLPLLSRLFAIACLKLNHPFYKTMVGFGSLISEEKRT
jgi:hypothetical protein